VEWPWGTKETWINPKPSRDGILRIKQGTSRTGRIRTRDSEFPDLLGRPKS
jgi:hypothetical protein